MKTAKQLRESQAAQSKEAKRARRTAEMASDSQERPLWGVGSQQPTDLPDAVFQALGAASVCWTDEERVFDSTRAKQIGDELLAWIDKHYQKRMSSVAITCEDCGAEAAHPLQYPMHPSHSTGWQCHTCGFVFEGKDWA